MKSNRKVSPSLEDKLQGRSQRIDTVHFSEDKPVQGWIAGVDFPVLLYRQVFKNKDGSTGVLYLVCNDLDCDAETLKAIYKKVKLNHFQLRAKIYMAALKASLGQLRMLSAA